MGADIGSHVYCQATSTSSLHVDHALKGSRFSSCSSALEAKGASDKLALRPSYMAHSRPLGSVSSTHFPSGLEGGVFKLIRPSQPPTALAPCFLGWPTVDPWAPNFGTKLVLDY